METTTQSGKAAAASVGKAARQRQDALKWSLPGFGPMTRISTSFGEMHAQTLRERDVIRSGTGKLVPIQWVDRMLLDMDFLSVVTDAHAILIRAGSLGNGLPKADVVVSPCQKIATGRNPVDSQYIEAGKLVGRPGVLRKPEDMMTYTLFHCGEPVSVRMEGIWALVEP